jgi:elongation of very long chain fatty acids protein 6
MMENKPTTTHVVSHNACVLSAANRFYSNGKKRILLIYYISHILLYSFIRTHSRRNIVLSHHHKMKAFEIPSTFFDMFGQSHNTADVWMKERYHIPIYALILYVMHIFYLKSVMKKSDKPLPYIKQIKFVWDLFLAVMSFVGAAQLVPPLIVELQSKGFSGEVCTSSLQNMSPVLYYFAISKFLELFDTTLIILGKKNLIFLHWYHHMATLMYCWDGYVVRNSGGAIFTAMNLCVHTIMYAYYAATYFGRLPNFLRATITLLQLSQMVIGTVVTVVHVQCSGINQSQYYNSICALLMYLSYFVLFAKLFWESHVSKEKKSIAVKIVDSDTPSDKKKVKSN